MVKVADKSLYGQGYREANQQLAKENGELKQLLNHAYQQHLQQRVDLLQKGIEVSRLHRRVEELTHIERRFNAIKEVVASETRPVEFLESPSQQENLSQDETQNRTTYKTTSQLTEHSYALQTIHKTDSLDATCASSATIIYNQDNQTQQSTSTWDYIDPNETRPTPTKQGSNAMFQSTPVQSDPPTATPVARNKKNKRPDGPSTETPKYNLRKRSRI